jgi:bifunctional UDP-N-acetylglucosamine pyrophosphorylase/glucosamine-1-phosphate N-acetyltransferase
MSTAIVLAAGQGTRMKSARPKMMHTLAGRPLVHYPVRAALDAGASEVVVVVGFGREHVEEYLVQTFGKRVRIAVQTEQRGTGDAARCGLEMLGSAKEVVVLNGDAPLVRGEDIAKVIAAGKGGGLALATITVEDPSGYGRILRNDEGAILQIREERDLENDEQRAIREINPGVYATDAAWLKSALAKLEPWGAKKELYLTDIVASAKSAGVQVLGVPSSPEVLVGVNDRAQLADAEKRLHARIADRWRRDGVTVRDGARIDDAVEIAADTVIESGAVLRGATRIGPNVTIDVGCVLTDVIVEDGATLKPYSVLSGPTTVGVRAQIGPFSHLRPETHIGEDAHVGNFVETKKTRMDKGAKANHLAYLGDGIVGERANIGAGTIFCNYDGFRKHTTVIEADVFVGSDSQLVAPVRIGKGAYVATGTTVTMDVPPDALAIARTKQENKEGYAPRLRARLANAPSDRTKTSVSPPRKT